MSDQHTALLSYLQSHRAPCPRCRYELHNLTHPTCPECGEPLVLRVGSPDVRFGWLLVAAAPGCFSIIPAIFLLVPIWRSIGVPPPAGVPWPIMCADAFGFLSAASVYLMYRKRRALLALPTSRQFGFAALVWGVHILAFLLLLGALFLLQPGSRSKAATPAGPSGGGTGGSPATGVLQN